MGTQLQAVHWLGMDNILSDYLSRNVVDPTEWSLDRMMVRCLFEIWGRLQIDLFVSACNTHLSPWYCWTFHPEAIALDTLLQPWIGLSLHAFPLFLVLPKTLVKIWVDETEEVIVIAPTWLRRS